MRSCRASGPSMCSRIIRWLPALGRAAAVDGSARNTIRRRAGPTAARAARNCSVRAGVDRSRTGCSARLTQCGWESGAPLGGGATREPLPVWPGSRQGAGKPHETNGKSGHENAARGLLSGARPLRSGDRDRGSSGERRLGRPFLRRWAVSPGFSVAAPATGPVALRARIRRCRLPTVLPCRRCVDEGRRRGESDRVGCASRLL